MHAARIVVIAPPGCVNPPCKHILDTCWQRRGSIRSGMVSKCMAELRLNEALDLGFDAIGEIPIERYFVKVARFKSCLQQPRGHCANGRFVQLPFGKQLLSRRQRPTRSILPAKPDQLLTVICHRLFVLLCPYPDVKLARLRRQRLFNHLTSKPQ
jgi:hypothetical protein